MHAFYYGNLVPITEKIVQFVEFLESFIKFTVDCLMAKMIMMTTLMHRLPSNDVFGQL